MNVKTRSLLRYILPALGGLFVTYLYNVVDGIFVGGVGSAALGAVNLAVPYITTVVAPTALFPMGGATVAAIRMGRGDSEGANQAFLTALSSTDTRLPRQKGLAALVDALREWDAVGTDQPGAARAVFRLAEVRARELAP